MSARHGSTVKAEISNVEDVRLDVRRVTITLDWTKADQLDMNPPPLQAAFGDDFLVMSGADYMGEMGYSLVPEESITMQLLRAAWYTAQVEM